MVEVRQRLSDQIRYTLHGKDDAQRNNVCLINLYITLGIPPRVIYVLCRYFNSNKRVAMLPAVDIAISERATNSARCSI